MISIGDPPVNMMYVQNSKRSTHNEFIIQYCSDSCKKEVIRIVKYIYADVSFCIVYILNAFKNNLQRPLPLQFTAIPPVPHSSFRC